MITVEVNASKKYDVVIGQGLLEQAGKYLSDISEGTRAAVITDSNVSSLYADTLEEALEREGFTVSTFVFEAGEENKRGETLLQMLSFIADSKLTRRDLVLALGGGVTGDMAGLAAAMYMRGIDYVQIPTSILAAVDSSVGGKTAIDLPQGKNLAGAFYQPSLVIIDADVFKTLPRRDFCSGFAEVVKYGMIADPKILESISGKSGRITDKTDEDGSDLCDIIARCVKIKASIVEEDEFESGKRQILNFGHTIGHAIEKASDYSIYHGEAVSVGMVMITEAAVRAGICEAKTLESLVQALKTFDLPLESSIADNRAELIGNIAFDKKSTGDGINIVIPERTGKCFIEKMTFDELGEFIR